MGRRLKWSGRSEFSAKINDRVRETPIAAAGAVFEEAVNIMAKAKPLTPVDTGTLVNTGSVMLPKVVGSAAEVELGFGGPSAPYAIVVHEDLEAAHAEGKQAKFLEQPMDEAAEGMEDRLADRMNRRLGK